MTYQDSRAYDYSRFEQGEIEKKPVIKLHKVSAAKSGNWAKTIILVASAVVVALMVINSKAIISELTSEISETRTELELAKRENIRLQTNLDAMVTLDKVEKSAVEDLGLQKTQQNQVHYIENSDESLAEVAPEQNNVFVSIGQWFNQLLEYLGF